jgi:hypothetical protein
MSDSVRRYQERRERRQAKNKANMDGFSVTDDYKLRRYQRLLKRAKIVGVNRFDWNEEDHPRDESGKFTNGAGVSGGSSEKGSQKQAGGKETGGKTNRSLTNKSFGSRYANTFKTNTGKSYPKIDSGSAFDEETLEEVNRLAKAGGFDAAYDAVIAKTKGNDICYQKDPEGQVVASIPGLSQKYNTKVVGKSDSIQKEYDRRVEAGKQITDDMIRISNSLGSRMMGLENCFKGGDSTARKIDKVKQKVLEKEKKTISDDEALAKMDDVVRFSYKCDHNNMVSQIKDLESELKKNGYAITDRDNKFLPDYDEEGNELPRDYKAVHLQVKSPGGELFEVQIHSEETVKTKHKNHRYFEEDRKINLKEHPEKKARHEYLHNKMVNNTSKMSVPRGIMDLPNTGKSLKKREELFRKIEENKKRRGK